MWSTRASICWKRATTAAAALALLGAGGAAGRVHTVRAGDTLEGLGKRYGVPVGTIAWANQITDIDRIVAGAKLAIPTGASLPVVRVATKPVAVVKPAGNTAVPKSPRPVAVPANRAKLRPLFAQFAKTAGVPVDLAMALAWQESGWQTQRVSSTKAVGVMQLMPDTVEFVSKNLLGLKQNLDPRDPAANIRMGTRFVRYLLDSNKGNVEGALASYYQGLRSVRENGPLEETKRFVANVKALRGRF